MLCGRSSTHASAVRRRSGRRWICIDVHVGKTASSGCSTYAGVISDKARNRQPVTRYAPCERACHSGQRSLRECWHRCALLSSTSFLLIRRCGLCKHAMKPKDGAQRLCHRLVDPASRFEVSPGGFTFIGWRTVTNSVQAKARCRSRHGDGCTPPHHRRRQLDTLNELQCYRSRYGAIGRCGPHHATRVVVHICIGMTDPDTGAVHLRRPCCSVLNAPRRRTGPPRAVE